MTEHQPADLIPSALAEVIDGMPIAVVLSIAYLDEDGNPKLLTWWDDDSPFWTRLGMARQLVDDMTPARSVRITDD